MKLRLATSVVLGLLLVAATAIGATAAAGGSLDTTFGTGGHVTGPAAMTMPSDPGLAIQKDGKIVQASTNACGTTCDFQIARFKSNGAVDTTFAGTGIAITDFGGADEYPYGVAIQSDGKIVVAGNRCAASCDFALARYNTDGTLDTTFDTDGKVTTDFTGGNFDWASGLAIQADGAIVVAGESDNGADNDFALARYTTAGALDTTFDTDGKVTTDFLGTEDAAYSVAIQADGRIVAAGRAGSGIVGDFGLARYNTNGALDTTFDSDGKVMTDFAGNTDAAYSVAIQADGKIVAGGETDSGSNYDFGLARYTSAGSLDPTFDADGRVVTDPSAGDWDEAYSVKVQSDGRILAVGTTCGTCDGAVIRYNSNGSPDTSFDTDGFVIDTWGGAGAIYYSGALQKDGMIVAGGYTLPDRTALARYDYGTFLYRADAHIGSVGKGVWWGKQQVKAKINQGSSKTIKIGLDNLGTSSDSFMIHGANSKGKSKSSFSVSYWSGKKNITKEVTKGTYDTGSIASGAHKTIKMKITAKGSSGHKTFRLTQTSVGYAGSVDTVKVKAKIV